MYSEHFNTPFCKCKGDFAIFSSIKPSEHLFQLAIFITPRRDVVIEGKGSVVMRMVYKIFAVAIVLLSAALLATPAYALLGAGLGGYGIGAGLGAGACGNVAYGAPQDCIAQISCNIPVTTQVPTITTTCVPREVPITVPVQTSVPVQVPRVVVVPETVQVPTVTCAQSTTTVPVTVPVQTSVPVTSMVPQCYTVPLGCAGGAAAGPVPAPAAANICPPGAASGMPAGLSSSQLSGLMSSTPSASTGMAGAQGMQQGMQSAAMPQQAPQQMMPAR